MILIDSHFHLDEIIYLKCYKNIEEFIKNIRNNNIKYLLNINLNFNFFKKNIAKIRNYNEILNSYGIHPLSIKNKKINYEKLKKICELKYISAIGETGLDFLKEKNEIFIKNQIDSFIKHVNISLELNKPILIHTRNSSTYIVNIFKRNKDLKGIIHCFNYDIDTLRKILNYNFYISISGILTFKKSDYLRKLIKYIPLSRLLVETDSPYLTPEPYRGNYNKPIYIIETIKMISNLLNVDINFLSYKIYKNFINIFNLKN
ncbi:TatD family hydrolase [Candidatus Nardonella dryophthoridicola]|uniref:Putative metallodependent hydrolase TatD domain protein n=1 Tax=endosymbiont of Rhynchophorus ferrugineus TaxID=1972133 RepID=A0A2Z5TGM3_9GAMM|nr:TatD family hydrolase [Candidatus Nardonella dryophthoridicola]QTJ62952.1 TatD family hydrolase [Candidatus Nardonella dryophthoridicola]BBA85003.1 putative metallodependent hydrolase TatD domain protein [endosymbiont of Rhynchophorus ferrugineus]